MHAFGLNASALSQDHVSWGPLLNPYFSNETSDFMRYRSGTDHDIYNYIQFLLLSLGVVVVVVVVVLVVVVVVQ